MSNLKDFCVYDIETIPRPIFETHGQTERLYEHHFLSLSCTSYINVKYLQKYFVIKDDSPKSVERCVDDFVDYLKYLQSTLKFSDRILLAEEILKEEIANEHKSPRKSQKIKCLHWLQRQMKLHVFGFNSSRYDAPVLRKPLLKKLTEDGENMNISVIFKGSALFHIQTNELRFMDIMSFTVPCSMDDFVKTWLGKSVKLPYPYEDFTSVEEIVICKEYPTLEQFQTKMKPIDRVDSYELFSSTNGSTHMLYAY